MAMVGRSLTLLTVRMGGTATIHFLSPSSRVHVMQRNADRYFSVLRLKPSPSKGQKSSMAPLWAKGLKTGLLLILLEQLDRTATWFRNRISCLLWGGGGSQPAYSSCQGLTFPDPETLCLNASLGDSLHEHFSISGYYVLQMPILSSVTQNLNSPQWFQGENNWSLLLILWAPSTSLETQWFPHVNDQ